MGKAGTKIEGGDIGHKKEPWVLLQVQMFDVANQPDTEHPPWNINDFDHLPLTVLVDEESRIMNDAALKWKDKMSRIKQLEALRPSKTPAVAAALGAKGKSLRKHNTA